MLTSGMPPSILTQPSELRVNTMPACDLSVVIAQVDADAEVRQCLLALDRACRAVQAELVVVRAAGIGQLPALQTEAPMRLVEVTHDALVPQLWARGFEHARGRYVAFTLANCEVSAEWAQAVVSALGEGAAGVAGPIELTPDAGMVDRGVYYLRYSAFIPERVADADVPGEIPGDNASYAHDVLTRHRDVLADGFWEVLFHRRMRRESGGRLCTRRSARARFTGGVRFAHAMRHRFAHGRHFGAWRVEEGLRRPWQIVAAAPLVPWLLGLRAASRVFGFPRHRWPLLNGAPVLLALAAAWAAGEAVGAVRGARLPVLA
jgi:hypothetical protein